MITPNEETARQAESKRLAFEVAFVRGNFSAAWNIAYAHGMEAAAQIACDVVDTMPQLRVRSDTLIFQIQQAIRTALAAPPAKEDER